MQRFFYKRRLRKLNLRIRRCEKYDIWRKRILKRDGYTCVQCGAADCRLEVDHIKSFALILKQNKVRSMTAATKCRELWILDNGRTLCAPCHRLTDTYMKRLKK